MIIAIDYDGTYSLDHKFWNRVIDLCCNKHDIICVTARPECSPVEITPPCPVYYTSGAKKADYMRCQGVNIDIWIDDSPEGI